MRKLSSLILLLILLFNMIGYRAWFYYAEKKGNASMEARLDKNQYDENELVTISLPLDNPYQLEQSSYQRASGEVSFEGRTYQVVMRKVTDGNLILRCISDAHKTIIKKAKYELSNASADQTADGKAGSRNSIQKNFNGSDYTEHYFLTSAHLMFAITAVMQSAAATDALSDAYVAGAAKPPRYRA